MKLRYIKLTSLSSLLFPIILFGLTFISCKDQIYQTGFDEPEDPVIHDLSEWQNITPGLHSSFRSTDKRYAFRTVPVNQKIDKWACTGWKGERINLMFLLWSSEYQENISISAGPLSGSDNNIIDSTKITIYPLRYVLTDKFLSGCGYRSPDTIPASIVSDMLEYNQVFNLIPQSVRPVWVTIDIPQDVEKDIYTGIINIKSGENNSQPLNIELTVINRTLPDPSEWNFHLDLWQNPFAIARFHKVEPWSQEHIDILKSYLTMLAEAGQKCITTSIIHQPWGSQTYDPFSSMIRWIKNSNGTWMFDFSVFDQYVKLAMECGITRQINCYSMIPWGNQIQYFDEDSADYITVTVKPGTPEYEAIWKPFLHQFSYHLKQMGWLEKTTIAMDERGLEEMKNTIRLIQTTSPGIGITMAGAYHAEIQNDIHDYCLFIKPPVALNYRQERVEKDKITTFYTCCAKPEHPNNFTFSPPAEQTWMGWYAAAQGYSGYLRWAYNSWPENPLKDSRFSSWPAGDTYQVYPGPRSSMRFEKLREGIQDYEKIRIIKKTLKQYPETDSIRQKFDKTSEMFSLKNLSEKPAAHWVNSGKKVLEELSGLIEQKK
ncbi:MAG: DUF4091 domain-containing protein [Bacteroidetes bacterium]|nr:DUF4091 domain-containing protein [Bacteroidota bacterium]